MGIDQADRVPEQLLVARSKQRAGEYNAARDILLKTLSEVPDSASLLDALGSVEQDLGEYFEAERSLLSNSAERRLDRRGNALRRSRSAFECLHW